MKGFNFERYTPPMLNEKRLREIERKRRLRKEIFLVVLCSVIMQAYTLVVGLLLMEESPMMAWAWFAELMVNGFIGILAILIYFYWRKEARI